jgi:hypothetical protein
VEAISAYPDNIGKTKRLKDINGDDVEFVIEDEIIMHQTNNPNKLIVMQMLVHKLRDIPDEIEYRLGYYMLGVKPGMKGRWVWGQYCLMLPPEDFRILLKKAKEKHWDI